MEGFLECPPPDLTLLTGLLRGAPGSDEVFDSRESVRTFSFEEGPFIDKGASSFWYGPDEEL